MEVLDERPLDETEIVGVPHNGWDDDKAGAACGAPPAFACDQLIRTIANRPDQYRLQHTDLPNRGGELCKCLLVEVHARLVLVGDDAVDREIDQTRRVALDAFGL
jgi:hypothetical protein